MHQALRTLPKSLEWLWRGLEAIKQLKTMFQFKEEDEDEDKEVKLGSINMDRAYQDDIN
jgi:hypothetical protein